MDPAIARVANGLLDVDGGAELLELGVVANTGDAFIGGVFLNLEDRMKRSGRNISEVFGFASNSARSLCPASSGESCASAINSRAG